MAERHGAGFVFSPGEMQRELDARLMTQAMFAGKAGIAPNTVLRACSGKPVRARSFGAILRALGRIPKVV